MMCNDLFRLLRVLGCISVVRLYSLAQSASEEGEGDDDEEGDEDESPDLGEHDER